MHATPDLPAFLGAQVAQSMHTQLYQQNIIFLVGLAILRNQISYIFNVFSLNRKLVNTSKNRFAK